MDGQTTQIKKWANFPKSFLGLWCYWMAADKVFNNVNPAGSKMLGSPNLIKSVNNLVVDIRTYSPYIPSVTWSQLLETSNPLALFYVPKSLYPRPLPWPYHLTDSKTHPDGLHGVLPAASFSFLGMTTHNQAFWMFTEEENACGLAIFCQVTFVKSLHTWVKRARLPGGMGKAGRDLVNHQVDPAFYVLEAEGCKCGMRYERLHPLTARALFLYHHIEM